MSAETSIRNYILQNFLYTDDGEQLQNDDAWKTGAWIPSASRNW